MDHSAEMEKAREAAADAYDDFLRAKRHLKAAAMAAGVDIKESAHDQFDETVSRLRRKKSVLMDDSESYIRDNPVTCAALAFLSGILVSKILSK